VSNTPGSVTSNPVRLHVVAGNEAPTAVILSPPGGFLYSGGEIISFNGAATDPEDGVLSASAFRWRVTFHHGNHTVPFLGSSIGVTNGAFAIPMRGEQATNVFFRVLLTVTDSGGRQATAIRDIFPRTSTIAFASEPSGLSLRLEDQTLVMPASVNGVVGMKRALAAVTPGSLTGRIYDWQRWSDGGEVSHTIVVPASSTTLQATFRTPTTLVATNSVWKYLVTPTAPAASWKNLGFDDTAWPSGSAQLGYGDGDETTLIGFGPNPNDRYITTYFRQSFHVVDPKVFSALTIRLLRDDGGVVYLNGMEVLRSNMGGGSPDWRTEAPTTALPADETTTYYSTNAPPILLRAGTNVVAAEIHQNGTNSSDLSFALEMRAAEYDPHLTLARVGANLELSWPYPSAGYFLQSAPGLGDGSIWTTLDLPVVATNTQNRITLNVDSAEQFYRLKKQ
jgi:hypothetical protein